MNAVEYTRLAQYEDWYWWYRAQRRALVSALQSLNLAPNARILDAGCGSGRNLAELTKALAVKAHGIDVSEFAAAMWNGAPSAVKLRASINALPFDGNSFDAVYSVDVLPSAGVEPTEAIREMRRVLRPGGWLVLLVPAYQWLRSTHDDAVHCVHRFSRPELRGLVLSAKMSIERLNFLFWPFFPMLVAMRFWRRLSADDVRSDLSPLPDWFNDALFRVADAEQRLGRWLNVPFGTTLLAVARKQGI